MRELIVDKFCQLKPWRVMEYCTQIFGSVGLEKASENKEGNRVLLFPSRYRPLMALR